MKAAVLYGPGDVRVEEVDEPEPMPGEVVVRVLATGICPTDLRKFTGARKIERPLILGHEVAGVVHEVGEGVQDIAKGDRVAVYPFLYCGQCHYCLRGRVNLCTRLGALGAAAELGQVYPGSFAEYIRIPSRNVYRVGGAVSMEEAALAEPLSACLNGNLSCGIGLGSTVAVIGAGPIGLMHILLARAAGASLVIASDLMEHRREKALEVGADFALNPLEVDVVKEVKRLTDGVGVDAVIVAVGGKAEAKCTEDALKMVAKTGVVNIFAGTWPTTLMQVDPNTIHYAEVKLTGSYLSTPEHFKKALNLITTGRIKLKNIISHIMPLDQIEKAFSIALSREALKVEIKP